MTTIALQRTRNGLPNSAESATIRIVTQTGVEILPATLVIPASPGAYSYQTDSLVPGSYTIIWTFSNAGFPNDVITRVITLDAPIGRTDGVTLQEIEQAVARTIGPWIRVKATAGSTVSRLASTRLKSTVPLGAYEDHYMLRRGRTFNVDPSQEAWLSVYTSDDRIRMVASYDPTAGFLSNDQQWTNAPDSTNGEAVEILYLEPEYELRPAVLDGLARCFFWDTISVSTTGGGSNSINATAAAPWITSPRQIKGLSRSDGSGFAPYQASWFNVTQQGKNVIVWSEGIYAGNYSLDVLRPVKTLVNNETSFSGPNDDLDILYVNKEYAMWAGVLALWRTAPERIMPLTHEGLRPDQKTAAAEFTKHSLAIATQLPDRLMVRYGKLDITQIGNAAEPNT